MEIAIALILTVTVLLVLVALNRNLWQTIIDNHPVILRQSATERDRKEMMEELRYQAILVGDTGTVSDIDMGKYDGILPDLWHDGVPSSMYENLYIFRICGAVCDELPCPLNQRLWGTLEAVNDADAIHKGDLKVELTAIHVGYLYSLAVAVVQSISGIANTNEFPPISCSGIVKSVANAGRYMVYEGWVYVIKKET